MDDEISISFSGVGVTEFSAGGFLWYILGSVPWLSQDSCKRKEVDDC